MSREILFRGKRVEDGKWLYGYYSDEQAEDTDFPCIVPLEPDPDYDWEVDPETVGQYTGLKDKNGKKIFEGDIVRDDDGDVMMVKWLTEGAVFVLEPNPYVSVPFYSTLPSRIEVIGNIYDNRELLKE